MNNRFIFYGQGFRFFGFQWLARAIQSSPNIRVTYTHEVQDADNANFRENTDYLLKTRRPISPEMFFAVLDGHRPLNSNSFLMTFDDGLLSNYHTAKAFLDPLGIKAVFFIPTAILDLESEKSMRRFAARNITYPHKREDSLTPAQWQFMTAEHLKDLVANGHMVCPHTHNHALLRDIRSQTNLNTELVRPKEILEDLLGHDIRAFAFPIGTGRQVSARAYDCIRRHYDFCFTALSGVNTRETNPYYLYRNCLPGDAPIRYTILVFSDSYELYYLVKM